MTALMDATEAARQLGVTEATLADWRYRRRGPAYVRVGRLIRYDQADLDQYVARRRISPDNERNRP